MAQPPTAQQEGAPIVLRDLTLIRDRKVVRFDENIILLSDGSRLSWDRVLKATVDKSRQAEFDLLIENQGLPLYRLRRRIELADWSQVLSAAEPVYQQLLSGESLTTDTKYLAALGVMRGHQHAGQRTASVQPFLRAARLQPSISPELKKSLADQLLSPTEVETQLADDLVPIWFDLKSIETDFESLQSFLDATENSDSAGARIYFASLAAARSRQPALQPQRESSSDSATDQPAEQTQEERNQDRIDQAMTAIEELGKLPEPLRGWKVLLTAQMNLNQQRFEPARIALNNQRNYFDRAPPNQQAVAKLLKAQALKTATTDSARVDAILSLLSIPARWENQYPTLASAALYEAIQVAEKRETAEEMRIIRDELLAKYPSTYHGRLAKQPAAIDPFGG